MEGPRAFGHASKCFARPLGPVPAGTAPLTRTRTLTPSPTLTIIGGCALRCLRSKKHAVVRRVTDGLVKIGAKSRSEMGLLASCCGSAVPNCPHYYCIVPPTAATDTESISANLRRALRPVGTRVRLSGQTQQSQYCQE